MPVQADHARLSKRPLPDGGTFEERQKRFEAKATEIRARANSIAARSNELGASTAADMRALANWSRSSRTSPASPATIRPWRNGAPGRRSGRAGDEPAIAAGEFQRRAGRRRQRSEDIVDQHRCLRHERAGALRRFRRQGQLPPHCQRRADYRARRDCAIATLGVDLGILAMALLDPPADRTGAARRARRQRGTAAACRPPPSSSISRARSTPRSRAPPARTPTSNGCAVTSSITTAPSYFVIPNLYHRRTGTRSEELRALAMNQLTGVFADLAWVRALTPVRT